MAPRYTDSTVSNQEQIIPPGYTCIKSPDGHQYLVETYRVPATLATLEAEKMKKAMNVDGTAGGVRPYFYRVLLAVMNLWPP
jgi:hypothetical protein